MRWFFIILVLIMVPSLVLAECDCNSGEICKEGSCKTICPSASYGTPYAGCLDQRSFRCVFYGDCESSFSFDPRLNVLESGYGCEQGSCYICDEGFFFDGEGCTMSQNINYGEGDNFYEPLCLQANCDSQKEACNQVGKYLPEHKFHLGRPNCCGDDSFEKYNYFASVEDGLFTFIKEDDACCPHQFDCVKDSKCYSQGKRDGDFVCSKGIWKSYDAIPLGYSIVSSCTDTDEGLNFFLKGFMSSTDVISTLSDACIDSSTLQEYYCSDNTPSVTRYSCPEGYVCDDGRCITEQSAFLVAIIHKPKDGSSYPVGSRISEILEVDVRSKVEPEIIIKGNEFVKKGKNRYTIIISDGKTTKEQSLVVNGN